MAGRRATVFPEVRSPREMPGLHDMKRMKCSFVIVSEVIGQPTPERYDVSNIYSTDILLNLNFPAGALVVWYVHNNRLVSSGVSEMADNDDLICGSKGTLSRNEHQSSPSTFSWDYGDTEPSFHVSSCSPLNLLWTGDVSIAVTVYLTARTRGILVKQTYNLGVTGDQGNLTIPLPFPTGTEYNATLLPRKYGTTALNSGPHFVSDGGSTECLTLPVISDLQKTTSRPITFIVVMFGACLIVLVVLIFRRRPPLWSMLKPIRSLKINTPQSFRLRYHNYGSIPTDDSSDNQIPLVPLASS